jgi:hypothetical protein
VSTQVDLLILAIVGIILLGIVAARESEIGVDSRDLSDDPHRSSYPVCLS